MKRAHLPRAGRQRGLGLITAIFLLVFLVGMGAAMLSFVTGQNASVGLDVLGARAYQAARAGVEYGLYQKLRNGNCAATTSFALPAGTTLSSFSVTVTCTETANADTALNRYNVTAIACNRPAAGNVCPNPSNDSDYVQREVQVEFGAYPASAGTP